MNSTILQKQLEIPKKINVTVCITNCPPISHSSYSYHILLVVSHYLIPNRRKPTYILIVYHSCNERPQNSKFEKKVRDFLMSRFSFFLYLYIHYIYYLEVVYLNIKKDFGCHASHFSLSFGCHKIWTLTLMPCLPNFKGPS